MKVLQLRFTKIKGQLATLMNLWLAIGLVLLIGLFAFELSRYLLARDELKTNVEVAALSCQTALVSSGDPTNLANQTSAEAAGLQLFSQNSILGQPMTKAALSSSPTGMTPEAGQALINFQFLDPLTRKPVTQNGNSSIYNTPVDPSSAGTLIQATAAYAYTPAFTQFLGFGSAEFTLQYSTYSGVPKVDLMICLDTSGGMDNDTEVTFFQRYQAPSGTDWYMNPNPITGGNANSFIYGIFCGNTGSPPDYNALEPCEAQRIDNSNCVTIKHSEDPSVPNSNGLMIGAQTPPGNYCSTSWNTSSGYTSYNSDPDYTVPEKTIGVQNKQKIACLNSALIKSVRGPAYSKKRWEGILNSPIEKIVSLGQVKQIESLALNSDQSLLKLCEKVSGERKEQIANKVNLSKLDEKLSTIAFAPSFYVLDGSALSSSSSGLVPPNTVDSYTGSNGGTYLGCSREPGTGADTNAAIVPTGNGTCPPPTQFGPTLAPTVFTGAIVNGVMGATSSNGSMAFPFAAVAVEAMLGDLESPAAAQAAGIDTTALGVTPQAGWFAFYYNTARQYIQPYQAFVTALTGFMNEIAIVSDVHFGFVAFNDSVGNNATSVSNPVSLVSNYVDEPTMHMSPSGTVSLASTATYPLPLIALNPSASAGSSNQSTIINVLPTLSVWSTRNVTLALQTAYNQLKTNSRSGANQAIILAVSGIPNGADTSSAAITEAGTIGAAGIPIYIVCCSVQPSDDNDNYNAYTETGGSNGGVAAAAAHGSKYYWIDFNNSGEAQLVSAFANIARRLVSIVQ